MELDSKADQMQREGSQLGLKKYTEGKISPESHMTKEGRHGDLKRRAKIHRMMNLEFQTNWILEHTLHCEFNCLINVTVLLFGG